MRTPHLLASACTASDPEARYHQAELAIWEELARSLAEYPQIWRSLEEGAMVLGEEVDELWDEIRGNHVGRARCSPTRGERWRCPSRARVAGRGAPPARGPRTRTPKGGR